MIQPLPTDTPSLGSVIAASVAKQIYKIRVALPCRVESYDNVKQRCSVQPLLQDGDYDETATRKGVRLPVINDLPVMFFGFGPWRLTGPIAKGDIVTVLFSSTSIAKWLKRGGEVDPGDDHRHQLNDGIVVGGLHDLLTMPTEAPTDAVVLHSPVTIKLGGPNADEPPALNNEFSDFVNLFVTWVPIATDGGTALKTLITNYLAAHTGFPVGASKVLVE